MGETNERLSSVLAGEAAWKRQRAEAFSASRRPGYERGIAAHRAASEPAAETATYRIRTDALAAAAAAWPDKKTRSAKISELILMAARAELDSRRDTASTQSNQGPAL